MNSAMRIYKRKNGSWYVALPGNIRKSLQTKNEREAKAKLVQLEKEALKGRLIKLDEAERIRLNGFIQEYLENRQDLSASTRRMDELSLRILGDTMQPDIPLKLISTDKINRFKKISLSRGVSPISINTYIRHIKAALNYAVEMGYIDKKKLPVLSSLKTPQRLPRLLSPDEIKNILERSKNKNHEMYRIILFALWTGCRLSEILNIQWQDIKNNAIWVIGKGNKQRLIPLTAGAVEAIGSQKDIGNIFVKIHPNTVSHYFKQISRDVGISDIHFHNLRHSAATQMLSCGIPIEVVQKILGHVDLRTTQIYAQVVDEMKQTEMAKLRY